MKLYRNLILGAALALAVVTASASYAADPPAPPGPIVYAGLIDSDGQPIQLSPSQHCAIEAKIAYDLTTDQGRRAGVRPPERLDAIAAHASIAAYTGCRARIGYRNAWLK